MSDNAYEVWLVPTRNYYQRLYLKTLYKLIDQLKKNEENERIIALCEESLLIEPFEENIHIELMEALLRMGQNKSAMNHYEYSMSMLERELDVKPSQKFLDFNKRIQNNSSRIDDLDITAIQKNLEEDVANGAMYCSLEYFKFLFNIQKRKSLRNNERDYLCIITINRNGNGHNGSEMKKSIGDIFLVIQRSLRKGDVITSWNENQVLIMLHDVKENGTEVIQERLINNLREYTKISGNEIRMIFQPLFSENTLI